MPLVVGKYLRLLARLNKMAVKIITVEILRAEGLIKKSAETKVSVEDLKKLKLVK